MQSRPGLDQCSDNCVTGEGHTRMRKCVDCVKVREKPPQEPIGPRSNRCTYHHHERRRWAERNRQRAHRAGDAGFTPEPYKPQPLDDLYGLNRDRRIPAGDVGYLDDIANEVRRRRGAVDVLLAAGRTPPRDAVAHLSREVGLLLEELNALIWPEAVDPPGVAKRLPDLPGRLPPR